MNTYAPPYESPIEDSFAWEFAKHLDPAHDLQKQVEVNTIVGGFRLDFLVVTSQRKIGIECDGKEFHDYTRDMFRDAIIIGCSDIESIYRFGGKDICFHLNDALYTLTLREPDLFSSRGRGNLKRLASRDSQIYDCAEFIINNGTVDSPPIFIRALRRHHPNPVWKRLFDYAHANQNLNLDEIIQQSDRDGLKWFTD